MGRLVKGEGRVVPGEVLSAKHEAARILALAQAEADSVRAAAEAFARAEHETMAQHRAAAEGEGHAAGLAAGREQARAEITSLLVAARAEAEATRVAAQGTALVLARRMAEKIVGHAFHLEPALVVQVAERALAEVRAHDGPLILRAHPDDVAALESARPSWWSRAHGVLVEVRPDPTVDRHGCVIETPSGRLDARLSTQLDALERALAGALGGGPS